MANWATIIYGRTYEVDFRFLALPHDFDQAERDWTMTHIQVMTRSPEGLPNSPRWAVFKNARLCVVGIACMVRELLDRLPESGEDLTRDRTGRPLYTFVGYATRLENEGVEIPAFLNGELSLFSPPYQQYVSANWWAKPYEDRSRMAVPTEYQPLQFSTAVLRPDFKTSSWDLNLTEDEAVYLYPDTEEERQSLWAAAARQILAGQNVSLCLGLTLPRDAFRSPFLNATVADIVQRERVARIPERPMVVAQEGASASSEPTPSRQAARSREDNLDSLALLGGVLLGGSAGFVTARLLERKIAETVAYSLGGGLAGWLLVVGFNFLAETAASQRGASTTSRNSHRILPQKEDSAGVSAKRDTMLGFKEKTQPDSDEEDEFMGWS
jgi:hypothetical protein